MDNFFEIDKCAAILLAAGASARLGEPKQLLTYKGKSFLKNAVSTAIDSGLQPVVVVLGADSAKIRSELDENNVRVVCNDQWEEGIASSIRCGLRFLEEIDPAVDGAILMVCDQPFITTALISDLLTTQRKSGKPIVAAHYSGVAGTPALFHRNFFPELLALKGDRGAGSILRQKTDLTATVPFRLGAVDIDTQDDYEKLKAGL